MTKFELSVRIHNLTLICRRLDALIINCFDLLNESQRTEAINLINSGALESALAFIYHCCSEPTIQELRLEARKLRIVNYSRMGKEQLKGEIERAKRVAIKI